MVESISIDSWNSGKSKINWLRVQNQLDTGPTDPSGDAALPFEDEEEPTAPTIMSKEEPTTVTTGTLLTKDDGETSSVQSGERRQEVDMTCFQNVGEDEVYEEGIELRDDDTLVQYAIPTPKGGSSATARLIMVPIALKKVPSSLKNGAKKAPATIKKALANITPPHTPNGSKAEGSAASSSAKSMELACTSARKQRQEMERKKIERMIASGKLIVVKKDKENEEQVKKRKADMVDVQTDIAQQGGDAAEGEDKDKTPTTENEASKGKKLAVLLGAAGGVGLISMIGTRRVRSAPDRLVTTNTDTTENNIQEEGQDANANDGNGTTNEVKRRLLRAMSMREQKQVDDNEAQTQEDSFLDTFVRTESFLSLVSGQEQNEDQTSSKWDRVKILKRRKSKKEEESLWGTISTSAGTFWTDVQCGVEDVFDPNGPSLMDDVMEEWAIFWDE